MVENMMGHSEQDKYWLGFNIVAGIGTAKLQALLDAFGTAEAAWNASPLELERLGLDRRARENLLHARQTVDLEAKLTHVRRAGITLLHWNTADYPRYLREVPMPPPVLYMHGRLTEQDQFAVAIVGTRKLTSYGKQMARELAVGLAQKGITVVSGLAKGVDAVAHQAVLDAGGRTIAVLGSGLDHVYPPENRTLAKQIAESGQGAVISEYELGTKPQAKNFPPRNRIISGLSLGTIVVEGDMTSGAMITAKFALEQNREVFAVPGYVTSPASSGPNWLIQQGAKLITNVQDVLDELKLGEPAEKAAVQMALPTSPEEAELMPFLTREPQHVDDIARTADLPSAYVSSTLMMLELKGLVQHVGGMKYAKF